jgi:chromosomal replication initiation ATPase DnaA
MSTEDLIRRVAKARQTDVSRLRGPVRLRSVSSVRQECMWLMRVVLGMTFVDIARALRRRDHTGMMWGVRMVWRRVRARPEYEAELRALVVTP